MICLICGKEGATESYQDGRVHDWCRDAISFSRADILEFFNKHEFIVMSDALEKLMTSIRQYPRLAMSGNFLGKVLNGAVSRCLKRGDGIILPEDISIEVELPFSSL